MVPQWFEPTVSREEAEHRLQHKHIGNFLIRQSSQPGTLAVSVKTGRGKDDIKHFIIISQNGSVSLEDSELEFDSLVSLVNHYSTHRDEIPVWLRIMEHNRKVSAPAGFTRGDSPYVSMVGRQRTKSTIWVSSPVFRTEGSNPRDLEVINSVLKQDSDIQQQLSALLTDVLSTKKDFDHLGREDAEDTPIDATETGRSGLDRVGLIQQTDNRTCILVNQGESSGGSNYSANNDDDDDDYEDYSLPVDLEQNIYEIPDINIKKPEEDGPKILHSPQPINLNTSQENLPTSPVKHLESNEISKGLEPRRKSRTVDSNTELGSYTSQEKRASGPETRPTRYRKNNSVVQNPYRSIEAQVSACSPASSNLSKSCSNIFEELERRNGQNEPLRKSFVRKVSLNLSVRRNNNAQPIRKLSSIMKKMFPVPKSLSSLVKSPQENSDSWEYLADCGISPVYEEVKDIPRPDKYKETVQDKKKFENKVENGKHIYRSGSCDSLYESEYSISNPSSMDRHKLLSSGKQLPTEDKCQTKSAHTNPSPLLLNPTKPVRLNEHSGSSDRTDKEPTAKNVTRISVRSHSTSSAPRRKLSNFDNIFYV